MAMLECRIGKVKINAASVRSVRARWRTLGQTVFASRTLADALNDRGQQFPAKIGQRMRRRMARALINGKPYPAWLHRLDP